MSSAPATVTPRAQLAVKAARPRALPGAADRNRLGALQVWLDRCAGHFLEVDWEAADRAAGVLARRLRATLPAAELERAAFAAIPRGGLFVLGLLAHHLDLRPEQMAGAAPPHPGERSPWDSPAGDCPAGDRSPLVLVDDCALSGLRLGQELARRQGVGEHGVRQDSVRQHGVGQDSAGRRLVVAHLFSAPELRRRLLAAEPAVRACVAAGDLLDLSTVVYPQAELRRRWRQRWRQRTAGEGRYWIGLPQPLAFPWGEPDRPFWNPASGRVEDGWRFMPPHRCVKSRRRLEAALPAVEATPVGGAGWRCPRGVVWGDFGDTVWLCGTGGWGPAATGPQHGAPRDGRVFSLDGSAATAWRALVCGRGESGAAAAVAALYAVAPATAAADVHDLAASLAAAGLLDEALDEVPSGAPGGSSGLTGADGPGRRRGGRR